MLLKTRQNIRTDRFCVLKLHRLYGRLKINVFRISINNVLLLMHLFGISYLELVVAARALILPVYINHIKGQSIQLISFSSSKLIHWT